MAFSLMVRVGEQPSNQNAQQRYERNRGSPKEHPLRHFLAVPLLLFGAKLNGKEPAVIGRVVIRDRSGHLLPVLPDAEEDALEALAAFTAVGS